MYDFVYNILNNLTSLLLSVLGAHQSSLQIEVFFLKVHSEIKIKMEI